MSHSTHKQHRKTAAPMPPTPPTAAQAVPLPGAPPTKGLTHDLVLSHGALTELYYDEQTSYLGCVDADSQSEISDVDTVTGEICSSADVVSACGDAEYAAFTEKPCAYEGSASPTCCTDGAAFPPPRVTSASAPRSGSRQRSLLSSRRNNPYAMRVLPPACYQYIDPATLTEIVADDPETVVGARLDAGNALIGDLVDVEQLAAADAGAAASSSIDVYGSEEDWRPVYDGEGPHPVDPVNGPLEPTSYMGPYPTTSPYHYHAYATMAPPPQHLEEVAVVAGPAAPAAAPQPNVMCCYWKQGHCQMGDACWYSHDGTEDTPCHYGASCRKGHRQLVRSNPNIPAAMTRKPAAVVAAGPVTRHAPASENTFAPIYVPPRRYVHEPKPVKPSAPLANSDKPCPHCGAESSVKTQEFPLYEGNRCRMAVRGHCAECKRTFVVQA